MALLRSQVYRPSRTSLSIGEQARAGDQKGYVSGDGSVEQLATSARVAAVALKGRTVTGGSWDEARDGRGKVVVINVWGQWCPPCVGETDQLQAAWASLQATGRNVTLVGVNLRDSPVTAAAFLNGHGVTYPSISDQDSGGQPVLALQDKAPATPSTLLLDTQGRIAAGVLGPTTETTLVELVDQLLAEKTP